MRLRNWCFTSFNIDLNWGVTEDIKYIVWQVEKCPKSERLHLQGYVEFNKAFSFKRVKEILGDDTIHLESRKGSRVQARKYCMKEESRIAAPFDRDWETPC